MCFAEGEDQRHIAIDGKTIARQQRRRRPCDAMCCRRFARVCNPSLGNEASRGKGMEIPDALKLLDQLDLKDKIVTGDAMFCQKSIVAKIAEKGGGYVFPVKDNQKNLRENIATAFNEPVFPPRLCFEGAVEKGAWAHRTAFDRRASSKRRRHRERLVERETHLPRHALSAR